MARRYSAAALGGGSTRSDRMQSHRRLWCANHLCVALRATGLVRRRYRRVRLSLEAGRQADDWCDRSGGGGRERRDSVQLSCVCLAGTRCSCTWQRHGCRSLCISGGRRSGIPRQCSLQLTLDDARRQHTRSGACSRARDWHWHWHAHGRTAGARADCRCSLG